MILWFAACVAEQAPIPGEPAPPADTGAADSGSSTPAWDGRYTIVNLTAEQSGPWVIISLEMEPKVSMEGLFLQGYLYFAGRRIADFVNVVNGRATYHSLVVDPCGWYADIEYLSVEVCCDTAETSFTREVTRVWDAENTVTLVGGESGAEYVAMCGGEDEWMLLVRFPGSYAALAGYGTLTHIATQETIDLAASVEEHAMAQGLWSWQKSVDPRDTDNVRQFFHIE